MQQHTTHDAAPTARQAGPGPGAAHAADARELARTTRQHFEALQRARQPFDSIWEEVAEHMGPAYAGFTSEPGHPRRRREDLVDSTARRAANIFAAGMLAGVSSPSQRWFALGLEARELMDLPGARAWLQEVEDRFYATLERCGYYPQQALGYHQAGLFGWQCLFVDEDPAVPDAGIRFRALPLHEVYIDENHQGEVDTVMRRFRLTARQAAERFGAERLSGALRRALGQRRAEDREVEFLHAVTPAPRQGRCAGARQGLAYRSVYMELAGGHVLSVGGYAELPYVVTRAHRLPGTAYSYSPGTEALADAKMINEMKRLILEAGQLAVAPPYLVPDDGFVGRFSFEPRAMNYYRRAEGNSLADFGPLGVGGDPRFSFDLLAATRQDIHEAFFVDLFLAVSQRARTGSTPTALEVAELTAERMFLLGPLLVNQQRENFQRLFERLFRLMSRRGELPPAPPELAGQGLRVEYVSPLMLAQREAQARSVLRTYAEIAPIVAVAPQVLDLFHHDENVRRIMEQRGFPQTGVRTPDEVAALRQARGLAALAGELGAAGLPVAPGGAVGAQPGPVAPPQAALAPGAGEVG
ncbi:portal protein [Desulfocurvus vexinensis]|uniref:portal protein n=1 Tax=Desulfocurvus vexinensis TaxID=399548 RepID=UPI00048F6312|nr:portal protein [Desulfocurvus vexinensis]